MERDSVQSLLFYARALMLLNCLRASCLPLQNWHWDPWLASCLPRVRRSSQASTGERGHSRQGACWAAAGQGPRGGGPEACCKGAGVCCRGVAGGSAQSGCGLETERWSSRRLERGTGRQRGVERKEFGHGEERGHRRKEMGRSEALERARSVERGGLVGAALTRQSL